MVNYSNENRQNGGFTRSGVSVTLKMSGFGREEKGLDIPVCVILRDGRFLNFDDFMLGVLQSNLADGPVYFICYPNFSVDINDPNVLNSLTLNVKTKNLNNKINTREIANFYRVYYRLMKIHLAPKARNESIKGETMLMEANHEHSSIFVPRLLQWKDILSSNDWRFENINQPFASHSERSQIERVIQFPDGSIELKFLDNPARRSSSNRRTSWSLSTSYPLRPVPRPHSSSKTPEEANDDETFLLLTTVKTAPLQVKWSLLKDNKPAWLGMLKAGRAFEPNPDILHKQWIHLDNQVKIKCYVFTYTLKQRESFRDLWMADVRRIGCEIEFFKWFEMTSKIENCAESLQVIINKWYTTSNKDVESITPPLEGINILIVGTVIKASPFKEKSDTTGTMIKASPFKEKIDKTGNIIEKIDAQLNNFNFSIKDDKTPKTVSTIQKEPISTSQEKSTLLQKLASSRFHNMKNYHNKLSFPDLQYEENAFLSTSSHEGRSITEWNIDGLAEHQVYNKLHEMGVVITAYIMGGSADKDAANMIIADFWKERFISGLPPLFADKVRTQIQDRNKTGHKASECRSGAKKNKINLLGMDKETKGKLLSILDEPFSESSRTSDEYSDDEDIDIDYDSDKSQSGKDCTCTEAFCTCDSTLHIRVLSDHSKEALFDVIHHINDNEARNHFLLELKNLLLNTDKPKPNPIVEPFSMKQIMNRSTNHSEPSISDLRHEVSGLKEEFRNIKSRLSIIETDILTNQVPKRTTLQDLESDQKSSQENNDIEVVLPNINNDHLVVPFITNTGNDTSTSAAPGVTVISSIRPQSHHIPVKIVVS
ncbi:hypothetical protein H5410_044066 [Solanum commersonii]|uniref:Uncharacterized protein n=1 Tax=Solanum commersonii TaxID=4109 RepID=A0A9J5Y1Z1_SOLCO|nr:hypothetical protein H5410_044066 [Solanum commersonii]